MKLSDLPSIPEAPRSIQKGFPLKNLLGPEAIDCLARNVQLVHLRFDGASFRKQALSGLEDLEFMPRGQHIADALRRFLPDTYDRAIRILVDSLTPSRTETDKFGLAEFFYLPHSFFIANYGIDLEYNRGNDPFDISMNALHALTTRFTSEFAIRPFLIQRQERTLSQVMRWVNDPNPHVRRLCSEGTRPKLPWGKRIPAFIKDPTPTLPILELLKNDPSLYVRRSVANHLGDIAKDHPELVIGICRRWLKENASSNSKWLVRHAIRNLVKKQNGAALALHKIATQSGYANNGLRCHKV